MGKTHSKVLLELLRLKEIFLKLFDCWLRCPVCGMVSQMIFIEKMQENEGFILLAETIHLRSTYELVLLLGGPHALSSWRNLPVEMALLGDELPNTKKRVEAFPLKFWSLERWPELDVPIQDIGGTIGSSLTASSSSYSWTEVRSEFPDCVTWWLASAPLEFGFSWGNGR